MDDAVKTAAGEALHLTPREGYGRWAENYDGEDNPLVALEEPLVDPLLGDVAGARAIDIGCGTGRGEELAAKSPRAVKYIGRPMLLPLAAGAICERVRLSRPASPRSSA